MTQVIGVIRRRASWENELAGEDRDALTAEAKAAVPDGFALTQISLDRAKDGGATAKVAAMSTETQEIKASGAGYPAARAALLAEFDADDWQLLSTRVVED